MNDEQKAKEQLLDELAAMRRRVGELEAAVSEHKRVEDLTRGARVYAESIVETVREPLLVLDSNLRAISANKSFYRTFQVTPAETENLLIYELGGRQWDIPRLRELLEEILPENTHFQDFEVEHSFPTIGHRTMVLNARKIRPEENGPHLILLAIEDITERRRAEEDLASYRVHLEELVNERTAELARANKVLEGEIVERKRAEVELRRVNRALKTIGCSNQAIVRASEETELIHEICRIIVEVCCYRFVWVGLIEQHDQRVVRPIVLVGQEEGLLDALNVFWADTDRGRGHACMAIRTGEPCVVQHIPTKPTLVQWQAEATKRGQASALALPLDDGERVFGSLNLFAATTDAFVDEEIELLVELARDLSYGIKAARSRAEHNRAGEELRWAHEELQESYEALEQALGTVVAHEKLAAVGRLTAGVSHEILNPLNVITINLHMMLSNPEISPEMTEDLRIMEEQARRILKIFKDLLYFSHQRPPERRQLDLNETVKRTLSLLEHELRLRNIALEFKLAEELPKIFADQDQLQQVVLNLLTNARDATTDGGRILIQTTEAQTPFEGGRVLELRVEDTGPGIPTNILNKIFDPFFTTKPEDKGTGLGLSICHGIVEAHGGSIWAEHAEGGGAAFVIQLPIESTEEGSADQK